jgi:hypothetical protein
MPHIHWVARENKLEIPNDEEEVNTREMHKCDVKRTIQTRCRLRVKRFFFFLYSSDMYWVCFGVGL